MAGYFNLFMALLACSLLSCAQGKHGIARIQGYVTERVPGNIPVNPQGEPLHQGPDTLYLVFVEGTQEITWDTAWLNGKPFAIHATLITTLPLQAGTEKATGKEVVLAPATGNRLWQLGLSPLAGESPPPVEVKKGVLLLQGRAGTMLFHRKVEKLKVLLTTNSV